MGPFRILGGKKGVRVTFGSTFDPNVFSRAAGISLTRNKAVGQLEQHSNGRASATSFPTDTPVQTREPSHPDDDQ